MKYIAHLDLAANRSLKGERWQALATQIGAPLRDYDGPVPDMDRTINFIRNATGMVLPYENFLLSPELVDAIRDRVSNGVPLLVWISPNNVEKLNPFLIEYGFEGTKLAIHADGGTDSRIVILTREDSPDAFHPHPLLDGVNDLTIEMPHAIRYAGPTIPILTLPWERFMIVDRVSDYPVEWSSPELTCLALSPINETGGVLTISYGYSRFL